MSFKGFSIFRSGGHFVPELSGMILLILVEGHCEIIFEIGPLALEEISFEEIADGRTDKYRSQ